MNSFSKEMTMKKFSPSKLSKYFWLFSMTIVLAAIVVFAFCGFNLGLDFTGGYIQNIQVGHNLTDAEYNTLKGQINTVMNDNQLSIAQLQQQGDGADKMIIVQYQAKAGFSDESMNILNSEISTQLETSTGLTVTQAESKGPTASAELLKNALMAIFIALIFILIYIAIRFEFLSGVAALITLFHDALIMISCVVIFQIEINSAFIAAVITVLGYSINNTIIIFDRVRENCRKPSLSKLTNLQIADLSVKQTLQRTLNTAITTIIVVFLLAVIGVPQMQEFVVPILIGLLAGTYASIFISAPLWTTMMSKSKINFRQKNAMDNDIDVNAKIKNTISEETETQV